MELSGQLVEGVVTNLIHTESDDGCHDVPEKKMISLSEEQKDNLTMYYLATAEKISKHFGIVSK